MNVQEMTAGFKVLGNSSHRHADLGFVDQQHQRHHQQNHQEGRDHCNHLRLGRADRNRVGNPGNGGILFVQAARDVQHKILQRIAHADGGNHDGHPRRIAQRFVSHPLNRKADKHRGQQHQRNAQPQWQAGRGQIHHDDTGHHEHVAVGKVNQAQDAVYHRVADGDQCVLPADGNAGKQIWENGIPHGRSTSFPRELFFMET